MPNNREVDNLRDSWSAYRREVMSTLTRLGGEIDETRDNAKRDLKEVREELIRKAEDVDVDLREFKEKVIADLATLKTKSAILGSVGGAVLGAGAAFLVEALKK